MPQTALGHAFDRMMTKQATKNPMKSTACNAERCFAAHATGFKPAGSHVRNLQSIRCGFWGKGLYV
jgi:hypothetical protein